MGPHMLRSMLTSPVMALGGCNACFDLEVCGVLHVVLVNHSSAAALVQKSACKSEPTETELTWNCALTPSKNMLRRFSSTAASTCMVNDQLETTQKPQA